MIHIILSFSDWILVSKWSDEGIILNLNKQGEKEKIITKKDRLNKNLSQLIKDKII